MGKDGNRVRKTETPAAAEPVLGDILKRARLRKELTLRDVAGLTGVSNAHISQIENGTIKKPDISIVFRLASAYGLDFGALSEWVGYAGTSREVSRTSLEALVRAFGDLGAAEQQEALRFVQSLTNRSSS